MISKTLVCWAIKIGSYIILMPSCGPDTKGSLQKGTRPTEAYKWDSEVELNSQVNL